MNKDYRKIAFLILLIIFSFFSGCKDWEYDVEKNGIPFKKVYQSKKGTIVGYMENDQIIQGFPCAKGWIHFKRDWQLLSIQLSEDLMYKGNLLPAHTWIHFPSQKKPNGFVCAFPADLEIQGYLCGGNGGFKGTQTGFYKSGKLRSFFPPEDVVIDGVPCKATLLVNIKLFENGNLKSCKLSQAYQIDGENYKKGSIIEFAEKDNNQ